MKNKRNVSIHRMGTNDSGIVGIQMMASEMKPICPFCGHAFDEAASEGQMYECSECRKYFLVGQSYKGPSVEEKCKRIHPEKVFQDKMRIQAGQNLTTSETNMDKNGNKITIFEKTKNKHSRDNTYNGYYKHSGKVPLKGVAYVFILGTLLTIAIFFMYYLIFGFGMFLVNRGWKIARVVIVLIPIYGGVVGWTITKSCKIGKIRNSVLCTLFGMLFGVFAAYLDYAYFLFGSGLLFQLKAVVIIGASTAISWLYLSTPFCEHCNRWIEDKDLISPLEFIPEGLEVKSKLERGDYTDLTKLNRVDSEASAYTEIELQQCRSCRSLSLLTVTCVGVKGKDKYGNKKTLRVPIVCDLIIPEESYNMLKHLG